MLLLYEEARLLDEERFHEWLALLSKDIHYWLPVRENRFRKDRREPPTPDKWASVYNDRYEDLVDRVGRFDTGLAWNEDPPNRIRRFVTNIEVEHTDNPAELAVHSKVIVYRSRRQAEEVWFAGSRRDIVRRENSAWKIARRLIILDHHVFLDENVSIFF